MKWNLKCKKIGTDRTFFRNMARDKKMIRHFENLNYTKFKIDISKNLYYYTDKFF